MPAIALGLIAACALAFPSATGAQRLGPVLVIGDSLGVGTEPYLEQELAGIPVTSDVLGGRNSTQGLGVLAELLSPEHQIVVFALGTNDATPEELAANLVEAHALAGDRCFVVATVARSGLGAPYEPEAQMNAVIRDFAARNRNVRVAEWKAATDLQPGILYDGVHAYGDSYGLRASLIAGAVASCASSASGLPTGDGIPNPDRDALREGRTRPEPEPKPKRPEPLSRDEAWDLLADAVSSQIAIGALGGVE
jgi:hypothetical protein